MSYLRYDNRSKVEELFDRGQSFYNVITQQWLSPSPNESQALLFSADIGAVNFNGFDKDADRREFASNAREAAMSQATIIDDKSSAIEMISSSEGWGEDSFERVWASWVMREVHPSSFPNPEEPTFKSKSGIEWRLEIESHGNDEYCVFAYPEVLKAQKDKELFFIDRFRSMDRDEALRTAPMLAAGIAAYEPQFTQRVTATERDLVVHGLVEPQQSWDFELEPDPKFGDDGSEMLRITGPFGEVSVEGLYIGRPYGTPTKTYVSLSVFDNYYTPPGIHRNVAEWYQGVYQSDPCGSQINTNMTFDDVIDLINNPDPSEFYKGIGVGDSLVRERIFDEISEMLTTDYGEVYDIWTSPGAMTLSAEIPCFKKIADVELGENDSLGFSVAQEYLRHAAEQSDGFVADLSGTLAQAFDTWEAEQSAGFYSMNELIR